MVNNSKVIDLVVKKDLCIGCGICVFKCPNKALEMHWNESGFLVPKQIGSCDCNGDCLKVCPFNPFPKEEVKTEDELAKIYLNEATHSHKKIGKYIDIYAGYANEFRLTSSSGGIATYVLTQLLEKGIVDHVFSTKNSTEPGVHYEYAISSNKKDLFAASKTRYFPVTLATLMPEIHKLKGKVAIVGVACFIKAIRLAQHTEPKLKDKIPFLVGIICGGVKSRFFTEYLASKVGVLKENIKNPQFRIKDFNSSAGDYSFGCTNKTDDTLKSIKMRTVGDMWGTGFFKSNACDFCDDVTTELADISVGDAWLEPYVNEGKGTNVIATRSKIADNIIKQGIKKGDITIETLPLERFLASQQGSFNHRHNGLSVRIKKTKKNNITVPPKRFGDEKVNIFFNIVQKLRMRVRLKSLELWKTNPDAVIFDKRIKIYLKPIRIVTRLYNLRRDIINKLKKYKF